ncbi:nucleoside hydrolase [Deinococcus misasensis]|uniref:nucleoside hydrolase n=1 Tax=Deinococcus misasensis TaxID=392413 RepID=UPI000551D2D1|nr:nucleoside hydrolase [Deinococcus misasensis]
MTHRVLLDCDPGHDDAIAIFLALSSPEIELLGITATHGNVGLEHTVRNALVLTQLAQKEVPVYAGASTPLIREPIQATRVHGKTGLQASNLPEVVRSPEHLHAAQAIVDTVRNNPHEITLVATGPLTNVALAFRLAPELPSLLKKFVWMGGSTLYGNVTPSAEFNAFADPHAAHIVFHSGVKVHMFGLNVTLQVLVKEEHILTLQAMNTEVGRISAELMGHYVQFYRERYGLDGAALHDPCTIAYLIDPTLFSGTDQHVDIDIQEGINFGRTVSDHWGSHEAPNTWVATEANGEEVLKLILERLSTFQ